MSEAKNETCGGCGKAVAPGTYCPCDGEAKADALNDADATGAAKHGPITRAAYQAAIQAGFGPGCSAWSRETPTPQLNVSSEPRALELAEALRARGFRCGDPRPREPRLGGFSVDILAAPAPPAPTRLQCARTHRGAVCQMRGEHDECRFYAGPGRDPVSAAQLDREAAAVEVAVGQIWDSVGGSERVRGRYVVLAPNAEGAREAGPDSWEMRRLVDNKTAYMHHGARVRGEWTRVAGPETDRCSTCGERSRRTGEPYVCLGCVDIKKARGARGRAADMMIVDDPYKRALEAETPKVDPYQAHLVAQLDRASCQAEPSADLATATAQATDRAEEWRGEIKSLERRLEKTRASLALVEAAIDESRAPSERGRKAGGA